MRTLKALAAAFIALSILAAVPAAAERGPARSSSDLPALTTRAAGRPHEGPRRR